MPQERPKYVFWLVVAAVIAVLLAMSMLKALTAIARAAPLLLAVGILLAALAYKGWRKGDGKQ